MASEKAPGKQLAKSTEQYQLFEQASRPLFKKYEAAIREMRTRFEILDADLEYRLSRNPSLPQNAPYLCARHKKPSAHANGF